jgi:hypothetical protein
MNHLIIGGPTTYVILRKRDLGIKRPGMDVLQANAWTLYQENRNEIKPLIYAVMSPSSPLASL